MESIEVAIIGCGNRGRVYADYALSNPGKMKITAIAEPVAFRRKDTGDVFDVDMDKRFLTCKEFIDSGIKVDAVINGTMDKEHFETSMMILNAGFDMLLEKPIALNKSELMKIYRLSLEKNRRVMVCHVLRYAPFYVEIKKLILAGEIGEITSMATEENVSFHHYASAFLRGKWCNSDVCGSHMMMSKCCHDLDIITWLKNDSRPLYVASLGGLYNFIEEKFPKGAGLKCMVDCEIAKQCEYDAKKMYVEYDKCGFYAKEYLDDFEDRDSDEKLIWSLKENNPFGKCVWKCNNNIVDRQTVIIEFEDGCTVSHNLFCATARPERTIHIIGTKGEIYGELGEGKILLRKPDYSCPEVYSEKKIEIEHVNDDGHGGGDQRLVADFVDYINGNSTSTSTTELGDSIYGHLIGFGAHEAMVEKKVVEIERLI